METMSDEERWEAFLRRVRTENTMGDAALPYSDAQRSRLLQLWDRMVRSGCAKKLPVVAMNDCKMMLVAWNPDHAYLEVQITDGGEFDWFYRNRQSNLLEGTEDPIPELPESFWKRLVELDPWE